jgi:hypothetical protein
VTVRRPLHLLFSVGSAAAIVLGIACDSATGEVQGGECIFECDAGTSTASTWTSLYDDYFGPSVSSSCTAQTSCHGTAGESGALISGFVCGGSKQACWEGMTAGIAPDAGGFLPPIVTPGVADPTKTVLYQSLHQASPSADNAFCAKSTTLTDCNMPCNNASGCTVASAAYAFSSADLARVAAWIQAGAPND